MNLVPRSFNRGKRGIAGTMIFAMLGELRSDLSDPELPYFETLQDLLEITGEPHTYSEAFHQEGYVMGSGVINADFFNNHTHSWTE